MVRTSFATVDDYIAAQPVASQRVLRRVRRSIRAAVPSADESISYGIPAYKLNGRPVVYFAGWRHHYSLYPCTAALLAALEKELAPFEIEKGTIRFPLSEPVPVTVIEAVARQRAEEATGSEGTRSARGRTRSARGGTKSARGGTKSARKKR